jgi:hypothetical protein
VITHNLNYEGAPIFIFELARFIAEQPGVEIVIASPQDGPLRARVEQLGLKVQIWDASGLLGAKTPADFQAELKKLAASRHWDDTDLFVANTMLTFWAVHLAVLLESPAHCMFTRAIPLSVSLPSSCRPRCTTPWKRRFVWPRG